MALQDKYINPFTDFGFKKLFETAEIAKFTPDERTKYEESLKYYRDLKNVVDTSFDEGREEGKIEGQNRRQNGRQNRRQNRNRPPNESGRGASR